MIELKNLSFSYRKGRPVLSDLSLELKSGTVCGLLGRNGVGKTTMLNLMSGLLKPKSGTVSCNGHDPFKREVSFLNDIYIVPEEFVMPSMTLEEYVRINAPFYPRFSREDMERLLTMFEMSPDVHLSALSMGQRKKVFLSFAMACNTSILLFDEPTNGLDISAKRQFRVALSSVMDENKTIVISTHQVYDVEQILDHVVIADNNRILLNKSMCEVSERLRFNFTNDPRRAQEALYSLQVPAGFSIINYVEDPSQETEVNLESLFELTQHNPELVQCIFNPTTPPQFKTEGK